MSASLDVALGVSRVELHLSPVLPAHPAEVIPRKAPGFARSRSTVSAPIERRLLSTRFSRAFPWLHSTAPSPRAGLCQRLGGTPTCFAALRAVCRVCRVACRSSGGLDRDACRIAWHRARSGYPQHPAFNCLPLLESVARPRQLPSHTYVDGSSPLLSFASFPLGGVGYRAVANAA